MTTDARARTTRRRGRRHPRPHAAGPARILTGGIAVASTLLLVGLLGASARPNEPVPVVDLALTTRIAVPSTTAAPPPPPPPTTIVYVRRPASRATGATPAPVPRQSAPSATPSAPAPAPHRAPAPVTKTRGS